MQVQASTLGTAHALIMWWQLNLDNSGRNTLDTAPSWISTPAQTPVPTPANASPPPLHSHDASGAVCNDDRNFPQAIVPEPDEVELTAAQPGSESRTGQGVACRCEGDQQQQVKQQWRDHWKQCWTAVHPRLKLGEQFLLFPGASCV